MVTFHVMYFRYNSSIEGQKKKNQRKKSKKRNQDRRKSESEAEDDVTHTSQVHFFLVSFDQILLSWLLGIYSNHNFD